LCPFVATPKGAVAVPRCARSTQEDPMKSALLVGFSALWIAGCTGPAEPSDTSQVMAGSSSSNVFVTNDATYELGERVNADGELQSVEVIVDSGSSYLTPQSPNTTWIVDRAVAHSQQRSLLLGEVTGLGLYVRRCKKGDWVNAAETAFASDSELVQGTFEGEYLLAHFYANIQTNVLLDGDFECEVESTSEALVTLEGKQQQVQRVGRVEFAYVVLHHE
jgi:hypothetical protein